MTAILIRPVVVVEQAVPSILVTLPAGANVEFDLIEGQSDVRWEGKTYSVMLRDLLEAAHPAEWVTASGLTIVLRLPVITAIVKAVFGVVTPCGKGGFTQGGAYNVYAENKRVQCRMPHRHWTLRGHRNLRVPVGSLPNKFRANPAGDEDGVSCGVYFPFAVGFVNFASAANQSTSGEPSGQPRSCHRAYARAAI